MFLLVVKSVVILVSEKIFLNGEWILILLIKYSSGAWCVKVRIEILGFLWKKQAKRGNLPHEREKARQERGKKLGSCTNRGVEIRK